MTLTNLTIEWVEDDPLDKFYFKNPKKDKNIRKEGDVIRLIYFDWHAKGVIFHLPSNQIDASDRRYRGIGVVLEASWNYVGSPPKHITRGFRLEWELNPINYTRMINALNTFCNNYTVNISGVTDNSLEIASEVREKLMGTKSKKKKVGLTIIPSLNRTKEDLPPLDNSQRKAMESCLYNCFTLVQGPPGTGKTVTGVNTIYNLFRQTQAKVLVCASSNVAVDNMAEKLASIKGLNVVRVYSKAKEMFAKKGKVKLLDISLHKLAVEEEPELKELYQFKRYLLKQEHDHLINLKKTTEKRIIGRSDIVCCTCSAAGDERLNDIDFKSLLIDECGQATEPEALIPISRVRGKVVLMGDQKQLGPVIECKCAAQSGLKVSLFERLAKNPTGISFQVLDTQYRMHPSISEFPANMFYHRCSELIRKDCPNDCPKKWLKDHESTKNNISPAFPWPKRDQKGQQIPMLFIASHGLEGREGTSFSNFEEARIVNRLVKHLTESRNENKLDPKDIEIITPYNGQRTLLKKAFELLKKSKVEINSVDGFQGREKEFIIFSCVRSNEENMIGFLKDPKRLNVALTRAKSGLIVVGNPHLLQTNPDWKQFLIHCQSNGGLGYYGSGGNFRDFQEYDVQMNHRLFTVNQVMRNVRR